MSVQRLRKIHAFVHDCLFDRTRKRYHLHPWSSGFHEPPAYRLYASKDHLFEWRTIYKNVILGLEIQNRMTEKNLEHVEQLLRDYGLDQFRNARPSELSGGMRQRAALIRTLALNPDLLLLDEPFSALDYQTRLQVCDDVYRIIRKEKKTIILVTHDLSEAISMADRVLILSRRPATVQEIVSIHFADSGVLPMERRQASEFKQYFNEIWKELNVHGSP